MIIFSLISTHVNKLLLQVYFDKKNVLHNFIRYCNTIMHKRGTKSSILTYM